MGELVIVTGVPLPYLSWLYEFWVTNPRPPYMALAFFVWAVVATVVAVLYAWVWLPDWITEHGLAVSDREAALKQRDYWQRRAEFHREKIDLIEHLNSTVAEVLSSGPATEPPPIGEIRDPKDLATPHFMDLKPYIHAAANCPRPTPSPPPPPRKFPDVTDRQKCRAFFTR